MFPQRGVTDLPSKQINEFSQKGNRKKLSSWPDRLVFLLLQPCNVFQNQVSVILEVRVIWWKAVVTARSSWVHLRVEIGRRCGSNSMLLVALMIDSLLIELLLQGNSSL